MYLGPFLAEWKCSQLLRQVSELDFVIEITKKREIAWFTSRQDIFVMKQSGFPLIPYYAVKVCK